MQKYLYVLIILLTTSLAAVQNSQLIGVFQTFQELNNQFLNSDASQKQEFRQRLETYTYSEYAQALNLLESTFCPNPEEVLLKAFIATLLAAPKSAYELPSYTLGKLYLCQPERVLDQIAALPPEEKVFMLKTLRWGFHNATYGQVQMIENYGKLSKHLEHFETKNTR